MNTLPIYFATMTGNAQDLARKLQRRCMAEGVPAHSRDLADATPDDLRNHTQAVFIVSTWGDGEPPDDAADFWDALCAAGPSLSHLNYAVFGLGDHGYEQFNAFARQLDERLIQLGARRFLPRVEADVDFDDDFAAWQKCLLQHVSQLALRP